MTRWTGNSLVVDGVEVARLVPAQSLSGSPRYAVQWRAIRSKPCTFEAARHLAEAVSGIGVARPKRQARR
jgi:hypothetical protein